MKANKYKTIMFDDDCHVLRRTITGNVSEKNTNNIKSILKSRSKKFNCDHGLSSLRRQYERCGCLKAEHWSINKVDESSIDIIVILSYND
jgi:hypothetical protein